MKKILAVSLCAIMAVSAARADIASVEYVEGQTGVLTNLTTTAKENLVGAINEVADKANAAATQTAFDELKSTVDDLTTGDNSVGGQIDDKISDLDVTDAAVEKQFVTSVSETDGKITVSRAALVATDIPTIEQSQVNGLTTALSNKQDTISDIAEIRSGAAAGATAVQAVTSGTDNGTISVDGTDVAVTGLGTAAYTESSAYATSAQGALADAALPKATFDAFQETNTAEIAAAKKAGTDAATELNTYKGTVAETYQTKAAMATTATQGVNSTNGDSYYPTVNKTQDMISNSISNDIVNGYVGTLGSLNTTQKSTIVDAINEVDAEAAEKLATVNSTGSGVVKTVVKDGTTVQVTANTVELADMAADSVDSSKIVDASVTKADLATTVQTSLDKADAALPKSEFTTFQEANTVSIADAKKAGTDAAQDVVNLQATLTALATFPVECQNSETNCALLLKGGNLTWEKVTY